MEQGGRVVAKSKKKIEEELREQGGKVVAKSMKREEELREQGCRAIA